MRFPTPAEAAADSLIRSTNPGARGRVQLTRAVAKGKEFAPEMRVMYRIKQAQWNLALNERHANPPGSEYDATGELLYDTLYGVLMFVCGDAEYAGPPGAYDAADELVPMLDLAVQTAQFVENPQYPWTLQDVEELFSISFWREGDLVKIVSRHGVLGETDEQALLCGLREFVSRLGAEIKQRAPSILEWQSLAPLRSVAE